MGQSLSTSTPSSHHRTISRVEVDHFIEEIKTSLLGVRAGVAGKRDARAKNYHKDIQQERKKVAEVVGILLTSAFNERSPVSRVTRLAQVINSFFGARSRQARPYSQVSVLETKNEGEMNCAQNRVDLGDHSRPALLGLKQEIADAKSLLEEMDASIDAELNPVAPQ